MAEGIIVGGKLFPLYHPKTGARTPILNWEDEGYGWLQFRVGDGHNKERVEDIDLGVYHWTGSENKVETLINTLRNRELGVEFVIDHVGMLYQLCDPLLVDTADAGIANSRSFGVEIVNAGIRRWNTRWREPRYRKVKMGRRSRYDTTIHKETVRCWDFYPEQKMTAFALNETMVEAIPTYPRDVCLAAGVVSIDLRYIGRQGKHVIRGAVGHYQVSRRKIDPGTQLMLEMHAYMKHGVGSFLGDVSELGDEL